MAMRRSVRVPAAKPPREAARGKRAAPQGSGSRVKGPATEPPLAQWSKGALVRALERARATGDVAGALARLPYYQQAAAMQSCLAQQVALGRRIARLQAASGKAVGDEP